MSATLHVWVGRALRYALLRPEPLLRWAALLPVVVIAALLYEKLFRGVLYDALGKRLPLGFAAPAVAVLAAFAPAVLRLQLIAQPRVSVAILFAQGYLVEVLLGLALAWVALGTGSTVPGGLALAALWLLRLGLTVSFRGGVLPFLEVVAALLTPMVVALVLKRELAPHREALMEA